MMSVNCGVTDDRFSKREAISNILNALATKRVVQRAEIYSSILLISSLQIVIITPCHVYCQKSH